MKSRTIRSNDLYQDTVVEILTNEKSNLLLDNGTVLFERPLTEIVLDAIDQYNSGLKINVLLFAQTFKRRKAEMLIFKKQAGGQK